MVNQSEENFEIVDNTSVFWLFKLWLKNIILFLTWSLSFNFLQMVIFTTLLNVVELDVEINKIA